MINSMARSLVTAKKWYRNISAGNPQYSDMELISTVLVGSAGASSVTFTDGGAWSGYKHLQLRAVTSTTATSVSQTNLTARFNSDTGSTYAVHIIYATGSVVASAAATSQTSLPVGDMTNASPEFTPSIIDILDFANTSKYKTTRSFSGNHVTGIMLRTALRSGLWMSTAAISSINLFSSSDNLKAGSRISLYGIKG